MGKTMILWAALAAAYFSIDVARAADVSLPDPDSPTCDQYRLQSVRQLVICSAGEWRQWIDGQQNMSPDGIAEVNQMIRDRLKLVRAIDSGYLRTQKDQVVAFANLMDQEKRRQDARSVHLRELRTAMLGVMAARSAAVPTTDFSEPAMVPASPVKVPSYTCVRQYGLRDYTRCTAD